MPPDVPAAEFMDTYVQTWADYCEKGYRYFKGDKPKGRVEERRVIAVSSKVILSTS